MIITRIFQGLGNQLFQYAFGQALANRLRTEHLLDLRWFDNYSHHREFGLDRFRIDWTVAEEGDARKLLRRSGGALQQQLNYFMRKYTGVPINGMVKEDLTRQRPWRMARLNDDTYLDGYFTSEEFFSRYFPEARKQFRLKTPPSAENRNWMARMSLPNAVCVSVRRGDFVNHPIHDLCGDDYYHNALKAVKARIPNAELFVFSDEPDWVEQHMQFDLPFHIMKHNRPDFYEDFRLMYTCPNHVMPNSTYSWWAAWLAEKPDSLIIAPEKWLNSTEIDSSRVIPSRWEKVAT